MSFVPATVDLTGTNQILQGTDWVRDFAVTSGGSPVDLSGYDNVVPRAQFRSTVSSGTVVMTATMSWISSVGGTLRMTIPAAVTTALANTTQTGVYDVEIVKDSDGSIERIIKGSWSLDPEVTRT